MYSSHFTCRDGNKSDKTVVITCIDAEMEISQNIQLSFYMQRWNKSEYTVVVIHEGMEISQIIQQSLYMQGWKSVRKCSQ